MRLTSPSVLKSLLKKHNLWADKHLGQHFLTDEHALERVVEAGELQPTDVVLEIGPGCGVLTDALAPHARIIHAVELDSDIIPVLRETTAQYSNVIIHNQDIRTFPPPDEPYKVIANIPYYITGKILRYFLEELRHRPTLLVLMTQREVAEKISAKPPDMNILSVAVQTLGEPEVVAHVSSGSFYPPPKVDSAIIRIRTKEPPANLDLKHYFRIVRAAFGQSRKQIHNGLSANLALEADIVRAWLENAHIDPKRRPETLTIEEWVQLSAIAPADAFIASSSHPTDDRKRQTDSDSQR